MRNPSRRLHLSLLLAALALTACQRSVPRAALLTAAAGPATVAGVPARGIDPASGQPSNQPGNVAKPQPGDLPAVAPGPKPELPPTPTSTSGGGSNGAADPANPLERVLAGTVNLPTTIISDHGNGIISNNGSTLLGDAGAGLISNNGSGLIGKVKLDTYHVMLASGPEGFLANAFMYLTNRDEKFFLDKDTNQIFATSSDGGGHYGFRITDTNGFPAGKDVVVNALVNGNLRLTGYLVPDPSGTTLKINLATTTSSEYLRGEAFRQGKAMGAFDLATYQQVVTLTDQAITSGDIAALVTAPRPQGGTATVNAFDLRIDHVADLRNQYAVAISAVDKGNTLIKQISDAWKQLLGYRPAVVTSVLGNGRLPAVQTTFLTHGFVEGDQRGGPALPALQIPQGYPYGVATSARGDVFVASYTDSADSANIRWIKPDGTVTSLWLPNYPLNAPQHIVVERQPVDDFATNPPGTLLVSDVGYHRVYRVPIVDVALTDGITGLEKYPMEIVAGENTPDFPTGPRAASDAEHPQVVDGAGGYPAVDSSTQATSRWRLTDEGQRTYQTGAHAPVPNAARYALLYQPFGMTVDEQGNIYIADLGNQRVRMIPKADGSYFGYCQPLDANMDGEVDGFGAPTPMKAGCIYTIVGDPRWDTVRTLDDGAGRWFGEFAGDGGPAQQAKLDLPIDLAFQGGTLYICEYDNQRVRTVSRATGVIGTVVGSPPSGQRETSPGNFDFPPGQAGDGGLATAAQLSYPRSISVDATGRIYIADTDSGRIRLVDPATGNISTIAGRAHDLALATTDNFTDGDALGWCDLFDNQQVALDPNGNVLFTDARHLRVRKLWRQWE
ncbi:MAG: repeat containing protein [Cyanobacteria bacterium RYN_339]|nr:repeat containing protein [Cyanobacteria bacterium RYN_339]